MVTHVNRAVVPVVGWLALLAWSAAAAPAAEAPTVVVNGQTVATTHAPINYGGLVMLPMRDVFVALAAHVQYVPGERKIIATRGGTVIRLYLGTPVATVNDQPVQLTSPPTLIDGVTYVPLRFPAEAFGGTVRWDQATRTAYIDLPASTASPTTPSSTPPGSATTPRTPAGPVTKIAWKASLARAKTQAKNEHKLVLIDFYSETCAPCRRMAKAAWIDPGVITLLDKFVCVRVDTDRNRALTVRYRVAAVPLVMVMRPDGTIARRYLGYQDAAQMRRHLEEVLADEVK